MFDALGDRMKKNYENRSRFYLPRRIPVIIRVDGRCFHTYTKGLTRPFCTHLSLLMAETATALVKEIQGAKLAYFQSDEISILVTDYDQLTTEAYFDYTLSKITSITAAIASVTFTLGSGNLFDGAIKPAVFDSRAFSIPKEEVANYFIWRQKDATRNSISSVAQSLYSSKELHGKNQADLQEMIFRKGINWNDYPVIHKRGACIKKSEGQWITDFNIPVFTEDRKYIEELI